MEGRADRQSGCRRRAPLAAPVHLLRQSNTQATTFFRCTFTPQPRAKTTCVAGPLLSHPSSGHGRVVRAIDTFPPRAHLPYHRKNIGRATVNDSWAHHGRLGNGLNATESTAFATDLPRCHVPPSRPFSSATLAGAPAPLFWSTR